MLASVSAVRSMSLARMKVPIQCISKRSSLTAAASEDMKGTKEGAGQCSGRTAPAQKLHSDMRMRTNSATRGNINRIDVQDTPWHCMISPSSRSCSHGMAKMHCYKASFSYLQ